MVVGRIIAWASVVLVAILGAIGACGYLVFTRAHSDPLQRADAIIVLGGEHDGREQYGVELAKQGYAPVVVLSNPYPPDDAVMRGLCDTSVNAISVICRRPVPGTTRGEALFTQQLATERGWRKIIIVTWRYHLSRARFVFSQCFSEQQSSVMMLAVPRDYDYSVFEWESVYLYQIAGFMKALSQGSCAESG